MTEEELNRIIAEQMNTLNHKGIDDFQGLSPDQMHLLLNEPFHANSILSLKPITEDLCDRTPMLRQIESLAALIREGKNCKLTSRGAMSPTLVKRLYECGHITEGDIEAGITKRFWEDETPSVIFARFLLQSMGIVKIQKEVLSVTRKGEKQLQNRAQLFKDLLHHYIFRLHWGYLDIHPSEELGQVGAFYTLYLLHLFGNDYQPDTVYATHYFRAFPMLRINNLSESCYHWRSTYRFLRYFGWIEVREVGKRPDHHFEIRKTGVFEDCFGFG